MTAQPVLTDLITSTDHEAYWADIGADPAVRPATYFDGSPVWLVTGYEEVQTVLKDPARFSNDINSRRESLDVLAAAGLPDDVAPYLSQTLGASDPPDHSRLRKLVSRAFTVRRITDLKPRIQILVDELIDGFGDEIDFVEQFAYPLPVRVICELLGVPADDADQWRTWSGGLTAPDPVRIADSARGLVGYMSDLIAAKRSAPGDDLLSALIQVQETDGDRLSDRELTSLSLTILLAGHATTVSVLTDAMLLLLADPVRSARLRIEPDLVSSTIEELLRVAGPSEVAPMRYATTQLQLGGVTIPAGDPVQVVYATANRDPRRFADPNRLDLGREENRHLSFGDGIHYCLGAALARAESELSLRSLLTRCSAFTVEVPIDQLGWQPGIARTLTSLPVRVRRSPAP